MKNIFHAAVCAASLLFFSMSLYSCFVCVNPNGSQSSLPAKIKLSGQIETKTYSFESMTSLSFRGYATEAHYVQKDTVPCIVITADKAVLDIIDIDEKEGHVSYELSMYNSNSDRVYVKIYSPSLELLEIAGSANMVFDQDFHSDKDFILELTGSADVKVQKIEVPDVILTVNGSGSLETGAILSDESSISLSGSGDISVKSVKSTKTNLSLSGSGDFRVSCLDVSEANASIAGSGDMEILKAKALRLTADSAGSGDLELEEIDTENLTATISGSGDMAISGKALHASISTAGSASADIRHLACDNVTLEKSGSSRIITAK